MTGPRSESDTDLPGPRAKLVLGVIPLLLAGAWGLAVAYEQYSANRDVTNCRACHGDFRASTYTSLSDGTEWTFDMESGLHDVHRRSMLNGACSACHGGAGSGYFPVLIGRSAGDANVGTFSCSGCHGRQEDWTGSALEPTQGWGAGLRQQHWNADAAHPTMDLKVCATCHQDRQGGVTDANPASYTPAGENVNPPFYGLAYGASDIPDDACNPAPAFDEDYTGGANLGLDNDGDGIYDESDPDCAGAHAPVANDDAYSTDEDVTLNVAAPGVLANDVDADGNSLTAALDDAPLSGALMLNADGSFTYLADLDFFGVDSFTYHANDGTADSGIATVTITIHDVNDPPLADADGPYSGSVGVAVPFVGSGSSDADGTIVSYEWNFGDGGTGTGVSPTHTYAAAGLYTVTLTVTDDDGATDTTSTMADIQAVGEGDAWLEWMRAPKKRRLTERNRGPLTLTVTVKGDSTVDQDVTVSLTATPADENVLVSVNNSPLTEPMPAGDRRTAFGFQATARCVVLDGSIYNVGWTARIVGASQNGDPTNDEVTAATQVLCVRPR